jgi:acyl-CoA thioester hydrolase
MKNSPSSASSPNNPVPPPLPSVPIDVEGRVRYSEVDRMGIAHNKNYFEWFEIARTEFCRRKGLPYAEIEARGFYLVVAESSCRYRKPLHYDEIFVVRVRLEEASPRKFVFGYVILAGEGRHEAASGRTVHVVVDANGSVVSLPQDLLDRLLA